MSNLPNHWRKTRSSKKLLSSGRIVAKLFVTTFAMVLTLLCSATYVSASSTHSSSHAISRDLITPAVAQSVYSRVWLQILTDAKTNQSAIPALVTNNVLNVIRAQVFCGCDQILGRPTSHEFSAPVETSYPLSFLAEIDIPTHSVIASGLFTLAPNVVLAVFQQTSAQAPWLVAYVSGYDGSSRTLTNSDSSMSRRATPSGFPAHTPLAQLVQALQSAREHGTIPSSNPWARYTAANTQPANTFRNLESTQASDIKSGWKFSGSYQIESHSRMFATPSGPLQCAAIAGLGTYAQGTYVQPPDQSAFLTTLAPGTYSSVTLASERDVCLIEGMPGKYRIDGLLGGEYSAVGNLAPA